MEGNKFDFLPSGITYQHVAVAHLMQKFPTLVKDVASIKTKWDRLMEVYRTLEAPETSVEDLEKALKELDRSPALNKDIARRHLYKGHNLEDWSEYHIDLAKR